MTTHMRKCQMCWIPILEDSQDNFCNFGCRTHVPRKEKNMPAIPQQTDESTEEAFSTTGSDLDQCAAAIISNAQANIVNGTEAPADLEVSNSDLLMIFRRCVEIMQDRSKDELSAKKQRLLAELAQLESIADPSGSSKTRSRGSKRHRSSKDDIATAMNKVAMTLATSDEKLSATRVTELSGIDKDLWATVARKLLAEKRMVSSGAGRAMVYGPGENKQTAISGTEAAAE